MDKRKVFKPSSHENFVWEETYQKEYDGEGREVGEHLVREELLSHEEAYKSIVSQKKEQRIEQRNIFIGGSCVVVFFILLYIITQ